MEERQQVTYLQNGHSPILPRDTHFTPNRPYTDRQELKKHKTLIHKLPQEIYKN